MAFEVPQQIKPIFDFTVQVILGAIGFIVVFMAAVSIAVIVKVAQGTGFVPHWVAKVPTVQKRRCLRWTFSASPCFC